MTTTEFTARFKEGASVLRTVLALASWLRLHDFSTYTFVLNGYTVNVHRNGALLRDEGHLVMEQEQ